MKFLSNNKAAPQAPDGDAGGGDGWRGAIARSGPWPNSGAVATKVFLVAVLVGILCGPAALAISAARGTPAPVQAPAPTATAHGEAAAETAAEKLVMLFLSSSAADQSALRALVSHAPTTIELPQQRPVPPDWVGAVHTEQTPASGGVTRWQVVVATTTGQLTTGWMVVVDTTPAGAKALTLPAPAAVPTGPTIGPVGEGLPTNHPAATTAAGYAAAALTGQPDLTRWAAPGHTPAPIHPAACTTAELQTATSLSGPVAAAPADQANAQVLVTLTCTIPGPNTTPPTATPATATPAATPAATASVVSKRSVQLLLQLTGRDGRWEISPNQPTTTTQPTTTNR